MLRYTVYITSQHLVIGDEVLEPVEHEYNIRAGNRSKAIIQALKKHGTEDPTVEKVDVIEWIP